MIGHIDQPLVNSIISSQDFFCCGWVYSEKEIDLIKIVIDDHDIGEAEYGLLRVDVKHAFPQCSGIENCGFTFSKNVNLIEGTYTLKIVVYEKAGDILTLGTITFNVKNKDNFTDKVSSVFTHILSKPPVIENLSDRRKRISFRYLNGDGLEIGALHNPLSISENAHVKYVDRFPSKELQKHYSELNPQQMVIIDIIDNGEILSTIQDNSLDFIIANHFLEHCENPIGTVCNHLKKIKTGGILYYAIPEKTYTFDRDRALTEFDHFVNDYENGPSTSRKDHFYEWVTFVDKKQDRNEIDARISTLMAMNYSIHYHVWDVNSIFKFWYKTNEYLKNSFTVLHFEQNENEVITVLQKK